MAEGTAADYDMLGAAYEQHAAESLVSHLLGTLRQLQGPRLGYQIDRFEHSLQSASRARRADERADLVVAALLHDIGDVLAPHNHSAAAAAILKPYVDDEAHWVVQHHGLFQGYYYFHHLGADRDSRDRYADAPHFDACVRFCERYDQNCFDPDYPNLGLHEFVPLVEEVFARPPRTGDADTPTNPPANLLPEKHP